MTLYNAILFLLLAAHFEASYCHVYGQYGQYESSFTHPSQGSFGTYRNPWSFSDYRNEFSVTPRVVKGSIATESVYKHLAELTITSRTGKVYLCSATMLDARHLLTAGHCLLKANNVENVDSSKSFAKIGILDREDTTADRKIWFDSSYVFKDFNPAVAPELIHDIGVIKLRTAIPSKYLFISYVIDTPSVGELVTIAGYGDTAPNTPSRWAREGIVMNDNFDTCLAKEDVGERWKFDRDTQVCSFPRLGVDTCEGDSGGPIFELKGGVMDQYGLTSFSNNLCLNDRYSAWYTKRLPYEPAISQILGGLTTAWKEITT